MNLPEMFTSLLTPRLDFVVIHLEGFSYFIYSYIQTCKYVTYYKIITSARNLNLICIGCKQGQVNHVCQFYLLVLCILHSKDFPLILPKFILKKTVWPKPWPSVFGQDDYMLLEILVDSGILSKALIVSKYNSLIKSFQAYLRNIINSCNHWKRFFSFTRQKID